MIVGVGISVPGDVGGLPPFVPFMFPLLAAWYRADQGITIATGVSQWNDLSGNGRHQLQATGTKQPLLIASAVNGLPALRSDGVDDMMAVAVALGQPQTIFCVTKVISPTQVNADTIWSESASLFLIDDATPRTLLGAGSNILYNQQVAKDAYKYVTCIINGASSFLYESGVQRATGDCGAGTGTSITLFNLPAGTHSMNCEIAEFMIYNRVLSAAEIAVVEGYLKGRYAL